MKGKNTLIPLFVFLFIFLCSSPVSAYLAVDMNVSYSGTITNSRGFACTNITGTFYCYMLGTTAASDIIVERYNATFGDRYYCDTGFNSAAGLVGFGIFNTTHVVWRQTDKTLRVVPIDNIAASTTCTGSGSFGSVGSSGSDWQSAGLYNATGLYFGSDGGFISSAGSLLFSSWWNTSDNILRLPNQTDNTTIIGADYNGNNNWLFSKYTSGVFDGYLANFETAYGIYYYTGQPPFFDVYNVSAATTWLYTWVGAYPSKRLYRANFTLLAAIGQGTTIMAIAPINNNSITANPPTLNISLSTANNGTITWYLDGANIGTTSITNNTSTQQKFFAPPSSISSGYHYWEANFTDIYSFTWSTGKQEFIEGRATIYNDGAEGVAQIVGDWFGIDDLGLSKQLTAIFLSLIMGMALPIILIVYSRKGLDPNNLLFIFIMVFYVSLVGFTLIGWFNIFIMIVLVVVGGLAFVKIGGIGGH